jgi:hypothetical protein
VNAISRRRIDELLLAQTIDGLTAAEARELEALLARHPRVDAAAYERTAAAICLAALGARPAMPRSLRERLERSALELAAKPPRSEG